MTFCQWVNEDLLPCSTLQPFFPRHISIETARKWLHHLGVEVIKDGRGIYIDGHEREDVEYRKLFLNSMVRLGFLNNQNAPTPEAAQAAQCLPSTSACDSQAIQSERKIFIFHDESIFNAYDDQKVQWGRSDMQTIRPKGKGSG